MNRTGIEWTDYTWNPVTGCTYGCDFCYARRLAKRLKGRYGYPLDEPFKPTLHQKRLQEPFDQKKPARIFTCSMGELFDPKVPEYWHDLVMDTIRLNPQHTFQILTKQPQNIYPITYPDNVWMGVSICRQHDLDRLKWLRKANTRIHFVSFEPLQEYIVSPGLEGIDWVIIGRQTPIKKGFRQDWAKDIIREAKIRRIPLFIKDNFGLPTPYQLFPTERLFDAS